MVKNAVVSHKHPHPLVRVHSLGAGWKLEPCGPLPDDRDVGPNGEPGWRQDWHVLGPGEASASLAFAHEQGACSDDAETKIPKAVLAKLDKLVDAITEAHLW